MVLKIKEPDVNNLLKVFRREPVKQVPLFELFMDLEISEYFAGRKLENADELETLKLVIDGYYNAGFDYATTHGCSMEFKVERRRKAASVSMNEGSVISDWASFYAYEWQDVSAYDFSKLDQIKNYLPKGMKLAVMGPGGVLENVTSLVGYENLCMMLYDNPELLEAIFDKVGQTLVEYYERSVPYDTVAFLISNDDWGFNSQTFLSVADLRKYVFPWHQKIAAVAHEHKKPILLHSCGYMMDVMNDIIDVMKYDAKHSFEDKIFSVEDSYKKWGDRIAILGGLDLQFLYASSPVKIKSRCTALLETAKEKGGYALGSGNSMAYYIPTEKYVAMIEAANEFNLKQ